MSVANKTPGTSLLSMQSISSGSLVVGSPVSVTTIFSARLAIRLGRTATTALTASPQFMVQWSGHASDNRAWFPLWNVPYSSDPALDLVAAESEAVSGTVAAGATVITVASTTNLLIGNYIALSNSTSSEIRQIQVVTTNTSLTVDALVGAATGLTLYNKAQVLTFPLDLREIQRIRAVVDTTGVGTAVLVEMLINTLDSVG